MVNYLKVSEEFDDNSLILNLDFPHSYKTEKIVAFKKYMVYGSGGTLKKEDSCEKELKSLKQVALINEEKMKKYLNLVKFRKELRNFLDHALKESLRVDYQTSEYLQLTKKLSDANTKRELAIKHKNKEKANKLRGLINFFEEGMEIIEQEQFSKFKDKKKEDFKFLGRKLWKFWKEIFHYLNYNKTHIEIKLLDASANLKDNIEHVERLKSEIDNINRKIESHKELHKKYGNPNAIFLLSENSGQVIAVLKDYEDYLKRELPKKINKNSVEKTLKKIEEQLDKTKTVKNLKSKTKNNPSVFLHEILSESLQDTKILKMKIEANKVRRLKLVFEKTRLYDNFYSNLVALSQENGVINKFYNVQDSYLIFNYGIEEIQSLLKISNLFSNGIVKTKQFGEYLGITIDFHEIIAKIFENFSKGQSTLTSNRTPFRLTLFQKLRLNTRNKKEVAASAIIISVLLTVLFIPNLFSPQPMGAQKYDLVKIDYQIWASDATKSYNVLDPLYDDTIWITMVPITENSSSGLILGLYDNLLGRKKKYESDFIWLDKCIDQDRNGIDDFSGESALSFGNSTDLHFNTYLMIRFEVLDIQKM